MALDGPLSAENVASLDRNDQWQHAAQGTNPSAPLPDVNFDDNNLIN